MTAAPHAFAAAAAAAALAAALAAGCLHGDPPASDTVLPTDAILYIRTNLADADLVLDGHFVGRVGMLRGGVAVEPGAHRLELRREDYFSTYLEVTLARSERRKVAMELLPILP